MEVFYFRKKINKFILCNAHNMNKKLNYNI